MAISFVAKSVRIVTILILFAFVLHLARREIEFLLPRPQILIGPVGRIYHRKLLVFRKRESHVLVTIVKRL